MEFDEIVKQLESKDNLKDICKYISTLKFEERFNALREMIYHIDIFLSEGNLTGADRMLNLAERLSIFVDENYEDRVPDKVRSLKIIAKKKRAKYFEYKGNHREAIKQYTSIIENLTQAEEESFLSEMLMEIGILEEQMGLKKEALEKFIRASSICKLKGDSFNYEAALFNCAHIYYDMSYYNKAEEYCREVVKHSKKSGKVLSPTAHSYLELANICELFNKDEEAKIYYKKALDSYRLLNEKVKMSDILNRIGTFEMFEGNLISASSIFQESLEVKKNVDYLQGKSNFFEVIGDTLRLAGNPKSALNYYNIAYHLYMESGGDNRKIVVKHKIYKILKGFNLVSKDMGTFIESFKKELPEFSNVIDLEKLDYAERGWEGERPDSGKDWHIPYRFKVNRKFLFYLVRNLAKIYGLMGKDEDRDKYSRLKDIVEKRYKKKN
jgi:tetratricopeptide (TPR) repeat protein